MNQPTPTAAPLAFELKDARYVCAECHDPRPATFGQTWHAPTCSFSRPLTLKSVAAALADKDLWPRCPRCGAGGNCEHREPGVTTPDFETVESSSGYQPDQSRHASHGTAVLIGIRCPVCRSVQPVGQIEDHVTCSSCGYVKQYDAIR